MFTSEVRMTIIDSEPEKQIKQRRYKAESRGVNYFENENGCKAILDERGEWGLPKVCGDPRVEDHNGTTSYCWAHLSQYTHRPTRR